MTLPDELLHFVQIRDKDKQLVQLVNTALADAAQRAGEHLVCHPGCTQCCHGAFAITALDAVRLRVAMLDLSESNPELAKSLTNRAMRYLDEFAGSFPGDKATGILGQSPDDLEAFEEFANEAACPALNPETGFCDVYEARPIACRVFGPPVRMKIDNSMADPEDPKSAAGFAVCDLCFTAATPKEVEACEMEVPRKAEQRLVDDLEEQIGSRPSETIVAYCLLPLNTTYIDPTAS